MVFALQASRTILARPSGIEIMPSSALFCLRCICLVPYSLACLCLCFLGCLERLAQHCLPCVSSDDSQLLSCKMHAKLAESLDVSATRKTIWRTILCILCPSAIMREDPEYLRYVEEGTKEVEAMREEIEKCNATLLSLRRERLECLDHYSTRSTEFFLKLEQSQRLQNHVDDLNRNAENRRIVSQMRAVALRTGYHGIVDWAEKISRTHDNLLHTTAQVAFVGAGLTYGSIFSASRGNIGLMCYAFALFDCGFIIPTVALALLKWASLRPKDTLFCSPHTWTLLLNVLTYMSVAAVGSAICLLNMTLFLLTFPLDASGQQKLATLQLDVPPTPAGSISLGCLLLAASIVSLCVVTHYTARGWDAFVHDFLGRRSEEVV